ncbi:hypothetical protein TB2_023789 [Malus domestica]
MAYVMPSMMAGTKEILGEAGMVAGIKEILGEASMVATQVVVDMAVVGVLVEEVVAEMEEGVATMVAADGVTVEESA